MEDKVLWIALKLFLVWLLVMASCLCICNCLFIRSDRMKSKETKLAAARASVERHKRFKRQYCPEDEEKLVGGGNPNQSQVTASGLIAHSNYIQHANPRFTLQRPSEDDVNRSQFLQQSKGRQPIDIDSGLRKGNSSKRCPTKISSELLLNLLRTPPSGKYLLFGKEERFPRIETASNPALNIEKLPTPIRIPYTAKRKVVPLPDGMTEMEKSDEMDDGDSSSSSMTLPQTPAFVITDAEGLERPRSSSFSGQSSFRLPSPYRIRVSPSPSPCPSSLGSSSISQHSPGLPSPSSPMMADGQVILDMGSVQEEEEHLHDLNPFRVNGNHNSSDSSPTQDPSGAVRESTVSDV